MLRKSFDLLNLAIILALGSISTLVIFTASKGLGINQLIFWIFGLIIFYFASNFYYPNLQKISLVFYLISTIFLLVVFFAGEEARGSIRWINLGILRFQPSEIAKISTIILLASFYVRRSAQSIKHLLYSLLISLPAFILIFLEPDIGSALAILVIWFGISYAANFNKKHILVFATLGMIILFLTYELLAPYQKQRLSTFSNPQKDPLGAGYNIIESQIAVGSGQFFGRGLGRGTQSQLNFLPESESDFIFASISEQLGFLGAAIIIGLLGTLISRITSTSQGVERFGQLLIVGTVSLLLYQFIINVGMNMGVLPVTGITLPLVSYGGSSLISTLFLLGIVFAIKRYNY